MADKSSTPPPSDPKIAPSLSRRISRPTSLHLGKSANAEWNQDIVLDEASPEAKKTTGSRPLEPPDMLRDSTLTPTSNVPPAVAPHLHRHHVHEKPMHSPCFVHSHLDKGVSLTDWLRTRQSGLNDLSSAGSASSLSSAGYSLSSSSSSTNSTVDSPDEEDFSSSLTKQLAETAVGVREMSKQLGRARVRSNIQNVLIITKARDNRLIKLTRELALYLMLKPRHGQNRGLVVYVDNQLRNSKRFDAEGIERDYPELFIPVPRRRTSSSTSLSGILDEFNSKETGQLRYWTSDMCSQSPHLFDFVVTLGGDGTVLFTSWLFQRIVPPVLPFALGSLGFLTNFDFADHQPVMDSALDSGIRVNLRMRFTCTVYRAIVNEKGKGRQAVKKGQTGEIMMKNVEQGGWEALEGGWSGATLPEQGGKAATKDKSIMCFSTRAVETFEVLNDLVVDRGPSPYVSQLELFGDEHHMTTVQADGLTVSTPTGSTAYSLSAGGSLVHPEIPALLITPICPHTLSFRPMLLPDSMELRICVPFNSRSTAWASFDGRGRVEIKQGDHIKITASKFPFPTVCADNQSTDWFQAISRTLKWNERERQKSFVVVEEDGPAKPKKKRSKPAPSEPRPEAVEELVEDEDEEDEEEDKFDIDDSSPEAAAAASASALVTSQTAKEEALGREKAQETIADDRLHRLAASALRKERSRSAKSRSRSGTRTTGRRGSSPRHVEFDLGRSSIDSNDSGVVADQDGTRDHINAPRSMSGKSRIPKDRDFDVDTVKTPTVANLGYGRGRGHSRTRSTENGHRAFAVWGHDESDSNASDSDSL
ncbi:ATP-NAD kinase-like domain-containing protein [Mycena capillaripes]|nr:ATP-NAD kinase-like domain-containing protein [Mycena capillaripes]